MDVIVRPAAVSLGKASSGPRVVDIRFLGDRFSVLVESNGETLRASTPDLNDLEVGDCVAVTFLGAGDTTPASSPASPTNQASEHFQQPGIFVYNRE